MIQMYTIYYNSAKRWKLENGLFELQNKDTEILHDKYPDTSNHDLWNQESLLFVQLNADHI